MTYSVKCSTCGEVFTAKGEADYQSVGDGGPACCTGIEMEEVECPVCKGSEVEVIEEVQEDFYD